MVSTKNIGKMISIHALVKRATKTPILIKADQNISIHALVKRATKPLRNYPVSQFISIHALVKRATTCLCVICVIVLYFNPRPREEGDGLG